MWSSESSRQQFHAIGSYIVEIVDVIFLSEREVLINFEEGDLIYEEGGFKLEGDLIYGVVSDKKVV